MKAEVFVPMRPTTDISATFVLRRRVWEAQKVDLHTLLPGKLRDVVVQKFLAGECIVVAFYPESNSWSFFPGPQLEGGMNSDNT